MVYICVFDYAYEAQDVIKACHKELREKGSFDTKRLSDIIFEQTKIITDLHLVRRFTWTNIKGAYVTKSHNSKNWRLYFPNPNGGGRCKTTETDGAALVSQCSSEYLESVQS